MNLISCNENCVYQNDGYCSLNDKGIINSTKVNGCNYFKERQTNQKNKNNNQTLS